MTQPGNQRFCCPICLDLLKDPVTPACGHSYCRSCIQTYWDSEEERGVFSCPQCGQNFRSRPELKTNIMLAGLMEELKRTGLQAAPTYDCSAGPEDVACDVCTGRKLKALKTCLVCVASYCENHLRPHFDATPLKRHKLVEPCERPQESICPHHDELLKTFCRTDQQCICYLCSVDQHQGHDIVSAAAERTERQKELEVTRLKIQQRVQDTEGDVKLLQQEAEAIRGSADGAVDHSDKIFSQMIRDLQRRSSEVKQQIKSRQDPEVTAEASQVRVQIQDMLREQPQPQTQPELQLQPEPEPVFRADFLRYSRRITLDSNTANSLLLLSDGNRKVKSLKRSPFYPDHPDRFTGWLQVLSRESLTGRCYWEVKMSGLGVAVAVAYKDISRIGVSEECAFGFNDKSWMLVRIGSNYVYCHNKIETVILSNGISRMGVYLDHSAGVLSFYRVSDTMTLIHSVRTTFTQPLHVGFRLVQYTCFGSKAKFCEPK